MKSCLISSINGRRKAINESGNGETSEIGDSSKKENDQLIIAITS